LLTTVLKYHVVPGAALRASALSNDQRLVTLLGPNVTVRLAVSGGGVNQTTTVRIIGVSSTATVVQADVVACRSIVHVIDTVLLPQPL
jgi:uncharacterized surface protein with fasciclin (FAS1) repeats